MKIHSTGTSPAGYPIINLRVGRDEVEILLGLIYCGLANTPKTPATAKTVERMKAMRRCLKPALEAQWMEHGDSTSTVAGSIPAEGAQSEPKEEAKPEADAEGWIPHVPGDDCPVSGDGQVRVRFRDGTISPTYARSGFWIWEKIRDCPTREIIAYKPA